MASAIPLQPVSTSLDTNTRYEPVPDTHLADHSYSSSHRSSRQSLIKSLKERGLFLDVRSIRWTITTQVLAILWLAPIISLLWLNFSRYISGATIGCIHNSCPFNPFDPTSSSKALRLSHDARNLVGVLQLVAKALEVWFIFVASSLVYTVMSFFVLRHGGLPLSLFTAYVEFSDIRIFLSPDFWLAAKSLPRSNGERRLKRDWALFGLIALIACLCVLANLMGPAIAVLAVPRLEQIETPGVAEKVFTTLNSEQPPAGNSSLLYCNADDLAVSNYNCTSLAYVTALDAWVASGQAYDGQISYLVSLWPNGTSKGSNEFAASQALYAVSQEWAVSFAINASTDDSMFWTPNRQMLRNMTGDLENFYTVSTGSSSNLHDGTERKTKDDAVLTSLHVNATQMYQPSPPDETFESLTSSLQTVLQRNGPVIGAEINFYQYTKWTWTYIDSFNKMILCLTGWSPSSAANSSWNSTKCLALGEKWQGGKPWSHTVENEMNMTGSANYSLWFSFYHASSAINFNSTNPLNVAGFDEKTCFVDNHSTDSPPSGCDYDKVFDLKGGQPPRRSDNTTDGYPYVTENVHTIFLDLYGATSAKSTAPYYFAIEFMPVSYIGNYSLDTSPYSNTLRLVEINQLPPNKQIYVHPSWMNAMFSSWKNPAYDSSDPRSAPMISELSDATQSIYGALADIIIYYRDLSTFYENVRTGDAYGLNRYRNLFYVSHLTTLHLLSMIPFNVTGLQDNAQGGEVLSRRALIEVWAYGLDTRTSIMGAVVAIAGCVVVLAYFALGTWTRIRVRSPTALLAAGLMHEPIEGELDEAHGDEAMAGRIRFVSNFRENGWLQYDKVA